MVEVTIEDDIRHELDTQLIPIQCADFCTPRKLTP
jgi:hypothetical protein